MSDNWWVSPEVLVLAAGRGMGKMLKYRNCKLVNPLQYVSSLSGHLQLPITLSASPASSLENYFEYLFCCSSLFLEPLIHINYFYHRIYWLQLAPVWVRLTLPNAFHIHVVNWWSRARYRSWYWAGAQAGAGEGAELSIKPITALSRQVS